MHRPVQRCSVPADPPRTVHHVPRQFRNRVHRPHILFCNRPGAAETRCGSRLLQQLPLALAAWQAVPATPALAVVQYNAEQGSDALRNIFGGLYVAFVIVFAAKVLQRRTKRSLQKRTTQMPDKIQKLMAEADEISAAPTSPLSALLGAAQSAFLCYVLFQLSDKIDSSFATKQVPSQFVARNITLTVQEIVRACSYLFTFICGMNCLGMTGLTMQLLIFPEKQQPENR